MEKHEWEKDKQRRKFEAIRSKNIVPEELLEIVFRVSELVMEARRNVSGIEPVDVDLTPPDKHQLGKPLLERARFPFDREQAERLFGDVMQVLENADGHLAESVKTVRDAMADGSLSFDQAVDRFLKNDEQYFRDFAEKTPKASKLLNFLVHTSLTPSLERVAENLAGRVSEKFWDHGTCPICGSLPYIGRLKEKEGYRYLSCSFCHADYRVKRIYCPFCGERDQAKLVYFEAEGEPGFRVDVCKTCNMYIKTVDFRQFDRISIPLLDDLESVVLDILAQNQGYSRATVSGFGF